MKRLIDAEALKQDLMLYGLMVFSDLDLVTKAVKIVNAQQTVEPEQGEWIVGDYKSKCSVCGADEADSIYGTEMWYGLGKSKFCPNCGARMKGSKGERA